MDKNAGNDGSMKVSWLEDGVTKMNTNHLHSTKMCSNEDVVIVDMQFLTSLLICTFSCHCWWYMVISIV